MKLLDISVAQVYAIMGSDFGGIYMRHCAFRIVLATR